MLTFELVNKNKITLCFLPTRCNHSLYGFICFYIISNLGTQYLSEVISWSSKLVLFTNFLVVYSHNTCMNFAKHFPMRASHSEDIYSIPNNTPPSSLAFVKAAIWAVNWGRLFFPSAHGRSHCRLPIFSFQRLILLLALGLHQTTIYSRAGARLDQYSFLDN